MENMENIEAGDDQLIAPKEVARLLGVSPKTITRWSIQGKLHPIITFGGHRRYRKSEIMKFLNQT